MHHSCKTSGSNRHNWKTTNYKASTVFLIINSLSSSQLKFWPSPKISVDNFIMAYLQRDGSMLAVLKGLQPHLTWSSLCKDAHPYYVGTGASSRALCRSCSYQFSKSELRTRTTLLRKLSSSIRPCEVNMCMNIQCIKLQSYRKTGPNKYLPWVRHLILV